MQTIKSIVFARKVWMDTKPNYLQNTIFSGEIVYNKSSEDPAHFILRLKSLEKAVPTYETVGNYTEEQYNNFGWARALKEKTPQGERAKG